MEIQAVISKSLGSSLDSMKKKPFAERCAKSTESQVVSGDPYPHSTGQLGYLDFCVHRATYNFTTLLTNLANGSASSSERELLNPYNN
eukprot:3343447-Amphidinium_carterae.1